jgi:hypothetical protein
MANKTKTPMGSPRQIRFPKDVNDELQRIADANGLEWIDAVRLSARFGLPLLKKKLGSALREAA